MLNSQCGAEKKNKTKLKCAIGKWDGIAKSRTKKVRIELEWQIKVYCGKISKFETIAN